MQIKCPKCGEICVGDAQSDEGENTATEVHGEEPVVLSGGLKIVGPFTCTTSTKETGRGGASSVSPGGSGIMTIMADVIQGAKIDGRLIAIAVKLWWWFGNVLLTVLFVWSLIKLSAFDNAMSMFESMLNSAVDEARGADRITANMMKRNIDLAVSGFVYVFLFVAWTFALWTHWVVYTIASGVLNAVAILRGRKSGDTA